jgi:polyisoprenyl-teichoic acid--peptidoglycan teichoic acid transferase
MSRSNPSSSKSRLSFDRLTVILLVVFLIIAIVGGYFAYNTVRGFTMETTSFKLPGDPVFAPGATKDPAASPVPGATSEAAIPEPVIDDAPAAKAWDGASRVNILIMGLDFRDWEKGETPRTDTMILFTIDPLSKTAGMLSIPRDMWVDIPGGFGYAKINTAYFLGASQKLPGGGPGLAMETVQDFIGVPIQYYAQIDFYAFEKFIDDLGGLDMKIRKEIKVDPLGPGNTVIIKPGTQTLTGPVALAYARQRYTEGGDFDRAQRQQDVIMAIRNQVVNFNMLPTLVQKSPQLYRDLSAGIHTNMTLDQIIQLAYLGQQIDLKNIKKGIISPQMVNFGKSPDGLDIEKPIADKIRVLRDQIFTTGGPLSPAAVASDPLELAKKEAARIQIQNGTQTGGLAEKTGDYLKSLGLNVQPPAGADRGYSQTVLIDYTGKPYAMSQLAKMMNVSSANVVSRFDPNAPVDVVVIVGDDWARTNPMQ